MNIERNTAGTKENEYRRPVTIARVYRPPSLLLLEAVDELPNERNLAYTKNVKHELFLLQVVSS